MAPPKVSVDGAVEGPVTVSVAAPGPLLVTAVSGAIVPTDWLLPTRSRVCALAAPASKMQLASRNKAPPEKARIVCRDGAPSTRAIRHHTAKRGAIWQYAVDCRGAAPRTDTHSPNP